MAESAQSTAAQLTLDGAAVVYRMFDIGYAIELNVAAALLAPSGPERSRPARIEAQALQIANPPVSVSLGVRELLIDGTPRRAQLAARLFDFGVCSMQLDIAAPDNASWADFAHSHAASRRRRPSRPWCPTR